MLPHRTLIVCSLVLLASACSCARPAASPSRFSADSSESARPGPPEASFEARRTQLVVYEHRSRPDRERSIERLTQIVRDSKYQDQRALVLLAALQLEGARRALGDGLSDGSSERELARANLQRALAIDDEYLPALNQLAVYYLDLARAHAHAERPAFTRLAGEQNQPSRRHLELASLVVERALEVDESYAPLRNTEGVIQVELGNYTAAGRAFARARQSDPGLLEAHMNYAALNLRFRGFSEAEQAYRAAVALAPDDYEAHLGLALALRGQLATGAPHRLGLEIERELALAAELEPLRPEVEYNRARFELARARTAHTGVEAVRAIERAITAFRRFVEKAGKEPRFAQDVAKAREQVADLKDTGPFILNAAQP